MPKRRPGLWKRSAFARQPPRQQAGRQGSAIARLRERQAQSHPKGKHAAKTDGQPSPHRRSSRQSTAKSGGASANLPPRSRRPAGSRNRHAATATWRWVMSQHDCRFRQIAIRRPRLRQGKHRDSHNHDSVAPANAGGRFSRHRCVHRTSCHEDNHRRSGVRCHPPGRRKPQRRRTSCLTHFNSPGRMRISTPNLFAACTS